MSPEECMFWYSVLSDAIVLCIVVVYVVNCVRVVFELGLRPVLNSLATGHF
jgi:hypothetical protein